MDIAITVTDDGPSKVSSKLSAKDKSSSSSASLAELFQFATTYDCVLMFLGTIGGMISGARQVNEKII
jgi:hypothetical protein